MSEVFYQAFCGYSQNNVLKLCLLSRHICMINAAKGCLCANHVLPLCFMKENTYLVPYFMTFVRHLVPAPPNAVYTVQNFLLFFSPAVVLYIFTPYVGSVFFCASFCAHRVRSVINPDLPPPRMPPKGKRPAVNNAYLTRVSKRRRCRDG